MDTKKTKIELAELAYRKGNFKEARTLVTDILSSEDSTDSHRKRAEKIDTATGSDPAAKIVFLFTALLMVWLIFRYIVN